MNLYDIVAPMSIEEAKSKKQRLDAKCWKGYKKSGTKVKGGVRVNNCVPMESRACPVCGQTPCNCTHVVAEDSWHAGDNAWSSDNHEMVEGRLSVGDPVIVTAPNEFEGKTGEISEFSPSGKFVVVNLYNYGEHSMHLSDVEYNQYADEEDEVDEGWSNRMVARRTGQQPTPYSVYVNGREWKSFADDDHAENVANKLRARFKQEGRDPGVITIAPTGYDKDMKEALSKNDLLGNLQKDLKKIKSKGDSNAWAKGDLYTGAQDQEDIDQMSRRDTSEPRPTAKQRKKEVGESATAPIIVPKRRAKEKQPAKFHIPYTADDYVPPAVALARDEEAKKKKGVAEDWIDDDAAEPLARYFADLYYGDFSATYKVKLTSHIYQAIQNGELSIEQLKADIDMLEKEKGIKEAETDYSKRRRREKDIDAGRPVAKQRQPKMTDYQRRRAQQKKEMELGESTNYWTRLQNERNSKLNSLVNELNESIK